MFAFVPSLAFAISGNEQIELAGQGRFDELAQALEADAAKKTLATPDRHALCYAYSKLKSYGKLFDCLAALEEQARGRNKETRLFGLDDVTPVIYLMRAEALIDVGRYDEAKAAAQQALNWYEREKSDDKDIEADSLAMLTLATVFAGDSQAAADYAARIEKIDTSWPVNNAYVNAKAYALARANIALGRWDRALQALEGNSKIFSFQVLLDNFFSGASASGKSNWMWQELPRGYMLAKALKETSRTAEAKAGYDRLLKVKEIEANGEIYWLALYDRGRLAEEENEIDSAIGFYERAIEVLEVQRATINTEANKIGFIGNRQEVYQRVIRLLLKTGKADRALEYVERSKSRALIDMLAAKVSAADFAKPSGDAGSALSAYLQAEADARVQRPATSVEVGGERRGKVVRAAEKLHQSAPEMASLVTVDHVRLDRIEQLIGTDETLIQYYLRGNDGFAFVVTRDSIRSFPLAVGDLESRIKEMRQMMERRDARSLALLRDLYDRLIRPLDGELKTKNLLIVPHGPLHYLSFASLNDGKDYLVDRFGLRTLPSASVLQYIHPRRAPPGAPMLVLGNPDLGNKQYDLPSAQVEAEAVASKAPKSKLLIRGAATETAFIEAAPNYPIIHIASHGEFMAETPLASALMLAKDAKNDGRLTVAELYSLKLNADLVTLSACQTGLGKIASGDDVVGLSRGVLYAGASSIVVSLWDVEDTATAYLMERFYLHLARENKREALRMAQMETKKRFPHPFFWAPFYLIGSEK